MKKIIFTLVLLLVINCSLAAYAAVDVEARLEIRHLKELNEQKFIEQEKSTALALTAQKEEVANAFAAAKEAEAAKTADQKEAITKAEVAAEKRMDSMNEFRGQLRDQAGTFMSRSESALAYNSLVTQIKDLQARVDKQEGRSLGIGDFTGWIVVACGMLIAWFAFMSYERKKPREDK